MSRFERFMEAWGLLTMDWMRSTGWRRWAGIAIGGVACWLMALLMASAWLLNAAKYWYRAAMNKVRR